MMSRSLLFFFSLFLCVSVELVSSACTGYAPLNPVYNIALVITGPSAPTGPQILPRGNPFFYSAPWNVTGNLGALSSGLYEFPFVNGYTVWLDKFYERTNGTNIMPLPNGASVYVNVTWFNVGSLGQAPGNTRTLVTNFTNGDFGTNYSVIIVPGPFVGSLNPVIQAPFMNYCESTKKCIALNALDATVGTYVCSAANPCVGKVAGSRRRDNTLSIFADPTFEPNAGLAVWRQKGIKKMATISGGDTWVPDVIPQVINTASLLGINSVYSYIFPVTGNITNDGKTPRGVAQAIKDSGAEAVFYGLSSTSTLAADNMLQILLAMKEIGYSPKIIQCGGGAAAQVQTAFKRLNATYVARNQTLDYVDVTQFFWSSFPWSEFNAGLNYRAITSPVNFEVFEANLTANWDSPRVFLNYLIEWQARRNFTSGRNPGFAVFSAVSASALNVAIKLLEKALTDDPSALQAASTQISVPSFWTRVQFDVYGRIVPSDATIYQIKSTSPVTGIDDIQYVSPLTIGIDPIFPIPSWDERVFDDGWLSGKNGNRDKVIVAVSSVLIVYCAMWLLFVLSHASDPVVRTSTPAFCALVIVGNITMIASNYFATSYVTDAHCKAAPWLLSLGFTLCYSGKTARLNKFNTHREKGKRKKVKNDSSWGVQVKGGIEEVSK